MKRVFCFIVIVLILSGCSFQSASNILQDDNSNVDTVIRNGYDAKFIKNSRGMMVFINNQLGWRVHNLDGGAGQQGVSLEKTSDGGKSWIEIANNQSKESTLPGSGSTGITFISETNGWMTSNMPGRIGLYRTIDGGMTWKEEDLRSPDNRFKDFNTQPPTFFSEKDGILFTNPDTDDPQEAALLFFTTHNGGQDWTAHADQLKGDSGDIHWDIDPKRSADYDVFYQDQKWYSVQLGRRI